jgi:hypothetical protein
MLPSCSPHAENATNQPRPSEGGAWLLLARTQSEFIGMIPIDVYFLVSLRTG